MPPKGHKLSEEAKEKIRQAQLGRKRPDVADRNRSKEQRKKVSESWKDDKIKEARVKKISKKSSEWQKGRTGDKSNRWMGDDVGYHGLHDWVYKTLGRPTKCEHCGRDGLTGQKIHWANKSQEYKREENDWLRLCASCHKKHDQK